MDCIFSPHTWTVHSAHTHRLYIQPIHIDYTFSPYTRTVHSAHIQGLYIQPTRMDWTFSPCVWTVHSVHTHGLYIQSIHMDCTFSPYTCMYVLIITCTTRSSYTFFCKLCVHCTDREYLLELQIIDLEITLFRYMTEDRLAIFTHVSEELSASIFRKHTLINQELAVFNKRDR